MYADDSTWAKLLTAKALDAFLFVDLGALFANIDRARGADLLAFAASCAFCSIDKWSAREHGCKDL